MGYESYEHRYIKSICSLAFLLFSKWATVIFAESWSGARNFSGQKSFNKIKAARLPNLSPTTHEGNALHGKIIEFSPWFYQNCILSGRFNPLATIRTFCPHFSENLKSFLLMYHVLQTKTAATLDSIKHIRWEHSPAVHFTIITKSKFPIH